MNHLNIKQIEEILPHRHPFLLVDYIEDYEPGEFAVGYKCVTFREDFFKGHFPQEPVMPGVLICEALAQTGAVALLSSNIISNKEIALGILEAVKVLVEEKGMVVNRYSYSEAGKILNEVGGVRILDTLTREEVKAILIKNLPNSQKITFNINIKSSYYFIFLLFTWKFKATVI